MISCLFFVLFFIIGFAWCACAFLGFVLCSLSVCLVFVVGVCGDCVESIVMLVISCVDAIQVFVMVLDFLISCYCCCFGSSRLMAFQTLVCGGSCP